MKKTFDDLREGDVFWAPPFEDDTGFWARVVQSAEDDFIYVDRYEEMSAAFNPSPEDRIVEWPRDSFPDFVEVVSEN